MTLVFRIVAAAVFIILFAFALKNTHDAMLRLFLGYEIHAPLVLILLGSFIAGAVLGILAVSPTLFRYRRELSRQKKTVVALETEREIRQASTALIAQPDVVPDAVRS